MVFDLTLLHFMLSAHSHTSISSPHPLLSITGSLSSVPSLLLESSATFSLLGSQHGHSLSCRVSPCSAGTQAGLTMSGAGRSRALVSQPPGWRGLSCSLHLSAPTHLAHWLLQHQNCPQGHHDILTAKSNSTFTRLTLGKLSATFDSVDHSLPCDF